MSEMTEKRDFTRSENAALDQQAPPTGEGAVVLDAVLAYIDRRIELAKHGTDQRFTNMAGLEKLRQDLIDRAEAGKKKYGTPLRFLNGRNPVIDGYQEICDSVMYSRQAKTEAPGTMFAAQFELLVQLASHIATEV